MKHALAKGATDVGPREADWIVAEAERRAHATGGRLSVVTEAVEMASRRAAGEPLQYVLGSQGFRRIDLEVGPGVFIPRPETEQMAGRAMDLLPQRGVAVDLCCGSGAIALAILDERPDATVFATESSPEAFSYALRNVERLAPRADGRSRFFEGDLFEPLPSELLGGVDVIVANPPYVAPSEADSLPADVRDQEPRSALFAGKEGLEVIERITSGAPRWLAPGGVLVLEIGEDQAPEVRAGLRRAGGYEDVVVERDLAGKYRVAIARSHAPWRSAAEALRDGLVAVVPTDTVYGLAGAASSDRAIETVFRLKKRPRDKPLPVLVHNLEAAERLSGMDLAARRLADRFWPGPLTLVVPRAPGFTADLGGDVATIALRIPDHHDLLRLLAATGPLAVTSANVSGHEAATAAEEARALFPDLPVMPGRGGAGLESTVVSVVGPPTVLRSGALSEEVVMSALRS